jgi:hypothetical protein
MVERQPLADRIGDLDKNREPAYRVTQCGRGYRLAAKQRGKRPRRGGIKARLLNGIRALWQAAPPSVRARRSDNNCYHSLPGTTSDNAAAGAWTPYSERRLYLFDSREIIAGTFGMVRSHKIGKLSRSAIRGCGSSPKAGSSKSLGCASTTAQRSLQPKLGCGKEQSSEQLRRRPRAGGRAAPGGKCPGNAALRYPS